MKGDPLPAAPIEQIRQHLVALRMPRALEMLDHLVQRIERGQLGTIEAIEALLAEELTIREGRRIKAALQMARLTPIKTLAGFDFSFQPSLDRNRITVLAALDFIDRHEVVHLHPLSPHSPAADARLHRRRDHLRFDVHHNGLDDAGVHRQVHH